MVESKVKSQLINEHRTSDILQKGNKDIKSENTFNFYSDQKDIKVCGFF